MRRAAGAAPRRSRGLSVLPDPEPCRGPAHCRGREHYRGLPQGLPGASCQREAPPGWGECGAQRPARGAALCWGRAGAHLRGERRGCCRLRTALLARGEVSRNLLSPQHVCPRLPCGGETPFSFPRRSSGAGRREGARCAGKGEVGAAGRCEFALLLFFVFFFFACGN